MKALVQKSLLGDSIETSVLGISLHLVIPAADSYVPLKNTELQSNEGHNLDIYSCQI